MLTDSCCLFSLLKMENESQNLSKDLSNDK